METCRNSLLEAQLLSLPRKELQARAKAEGVPANLKTSSIIEQLIKALSFTRWGNQKVTDGLKDATNSHHHQGPKSPSVLDLPKDMQPLHLLASSPLNKMTSLHLHGNMMSPTQVAKSLQHKAVPHPHLFKRDVDLEVDQESFAPVLEVPQQFNPQAVHSPVPEQQQLTLARIAKQQQIRNQAAAAPPSATHRVSVPGSTLSYLAGGQPANATATAASLKSGSGIGHCQKRVAASPLRKPAPVSPIRGAMNPMHGAAVSPMRGAVSSMHGSQAKSHQSKVVIPQSSSLGRSTSGQSPLAKSTSGISAQGGKSPRGHGIHNDHPRQPSSKGPDASARPGSSLARVGSALPSFGATTFKKAGVAPVSARPITPQRSLAPQSSTARPITPQRSLAPQSSTARPITPQRSLAPQRSTARPITPQRSLAPQRSMARPTTPLRSPLHMPARRVASESEQPDLDKRREDPAELILLDIVKRELLVSSDSHGSPNTEAVSLKSISGMGAAKQQFLSIVQSALVPQPIIAQTHGTSKQNATASHAHVALGEAPWLKPILLFGPSGVGKSMLAKALATEVSVSSVNPLNLNSDCPSLVSSVHQTKSMTRASPCQSYYVDVAALLQKHGANAAKIVQALFKVTKKRSGPICLVIDNLEAIQQAQQSDDFDASEASCRLRTMILVGFDEILYKAGGTATSVSQQSAKLSPQLPPHPIFVVGIAGHVAHSIDDGLARCFTAAKLYVALPDADTREALLFNDMAERKAALGVDDLEQLTRTTEGYSVTDLFRLCQRAAQISCIMNEAFITMSHFSAAFLEVQPSLSHSAAVLYLKWKAHLSSL